ncbi:hypothetical protein ACWDBO_46130 [Streptomyces mirabilis]|uniref:hypothetical protein n=1 Tax=Streptomyces mirabilis TaxID=68239 RepID=UPI0031B9FF0A
MMLAFLPEARVMGEEPAYAFSPRASAKRVQSSPPVSDQLVDLLLRGRELLALGLLPAGDDRRVAAAVATTVEAHEAAVGDRGEAGRAESAAQVVVAAGGDLRTARGSGGGGPQQPASARWRVK